jgi:hypothetical protein
VQVTDETVYRSWTPGGCVLADPEDVEEGDTVSIHGMVVEEDTFSATRVTIGVPLDCCTP